MFLLKKLLVALILPPTGPILLAFCGLWLTRAQLQRVQAIMILGGGTYSAAPEYSGNTVGSATLERLRHGARLARAIPLFAMQDLEVAPALSGSLLPGGLGPSREALHEYPGQLYNRIKE